MIGTTDGGKRGDCQHNSALSRGPSSLRRCGREHSGYGPDAIYACWLIFQLCMLPLFPHSNDIKLPFDDPA
jgi:hypothetical protein